MLTPLDQAHDLSGRQVYLATTAYNAPDYVKQASAADLYGSGELDTAAYADPGRRLFPHHTPAATWMSSAYLETFRQEHPADSGIQMIGARLSKAAEAHGIAEDVGQLREKVAAAHADPLSLLSDRDFAFVAEVEGRRERRLPLRNALEVKAASEWFSRHRGTFPWDLRQDMARRILEKQAATGAAVGGEQREILERTAGFGMCSKAAAVQAITRRVPHISDRETAAEFTKLAELVSTRRIEQTVGNAEFREKLAATLDKLDRTYGLATRYGEDLTMPEDTLCSLTEKAASAVLQQQVATTTGAVFDLEKLAGLPLATIRDYLGDDLANAITEDGLFISCEKAAEVLPTLPRPDAELLEQLAAEAGIKPHMKVAAANQGFTRQELLQLAARAAG